jgi:hypothetical protein
VDGVRVDQQRVDQQRVDQQRVDQQRVDQQRVDQQRVDQHYTECARRVLCTHVPCMHVQKFKANAHADTPSDCPERNCEDDRGIHARTHTYMCMQSWACTHPIEADVACHACMRTCPQ